MSSCLTFTLQGRWYVSGWAPRPASHQSLLVLPHHKLCAGHGITVVAPRHLPRAALPTVAAAVQDLTVCLLVPSVLRAEPGQIPSAVQLLQLLTLLLPPSPSALKDWLVVRMNQTV